MKVDVQKMDIDFMAFSGHKMYGPTGIGVLYGKFELLQDLVPRNYGGDMNAIFTKDGYYELREIPTRLEAGTPNIEGFIGLRACIDYINNIGMSQNKILKEIFGEKCNYREIFESTYEKRYMDINDGNLDVVGEYINEGIKEFKHIYNIGLVEIFANRECLKKLISFLKEKCNVKYVEIRKYLEISRGVMESLKKE